MTLDREYIERMVKEWHSESRRMWLDAQRSIQEAQQIKQKAIEQCRELDCSHRIEPWQEPE